MFVWIDALSMCFSCKNVSLDTFFCVSACAYASSCYGTNIFFSFGHSLQLVQKLNNVYPCVYMYMYIFVYT